MASSRSTFSEWLAEVGVKMRNRKRTLEKRSSRKHDTRVFVVCWLWIQASLGIKAGVVVKNLLIRQELKPWINERDDVRSLKTTKKIGSSCVVKSAKTQHREYFRRERNSLEVETWNKKNSYLISRLMLKEKKIDHNLKRLQGKKREKVTGELMLSRRDQIWSCWGKSGKLTEKRTRI